MMESQSFFESMERRTLLSAAVVGSTLQIAGTAKDDVIRVELDASDTNTLKVSVNDEASSFNIASSAIKLIRIEGRRGNDRIEIEQDNGAINIRTLIFGGAGNDTIEGGAARDRLHGEEGDDSIIGQSNRDILYGEDGDDSLLGANGDDSIDGGLGDDSVQ